MRHSVKKESSWASLSKHENTEQETMISLKCLIARTLEVNTNYAGMLLTNLTHHHMHIISGATRQTTKKTQQECLMVSLALRHKHI